MRTRNLKKDIRRGSSNRVADGATVLGEGRDPGDHAHVSQCSPNALKRKALAEDLQYQDATEPRVPAAIDRKREASTSRKRSDKDVRPL